MTCHGLGMPQLGEGVRRGEDSGTSVTGRCKDLFWVLKYASRDFFGLKIAWWTFLIEIILQVLILWGLVKIAPYHS